MPEEFDRYNEQPKEIPLTAKTKVLQTIVKILNDDLDPDNSIRAIAYRLDHPAKPRKIKALPDS